MDSITEIWFGDNEVWNWVDDRASFPVDEDGEYFDVERLDAFGGRKNGGGVKAACIFYKGSTDQEADPYMTDQVNSPYTHRGVSKIIWMGPSSGASEQPTWGGGGGGDSGYVGESTNIPPIKIRAEHYPNFLGSAYKKIGTGDKAGANPAEVLYCLLIGRYANVQATDPVVPTIPTDLIDTASFLASAAVLNTEGMGISFQWQRDSTVRQIINDIMNHVDGILAEDTKTGKLRFTLNRADYDPETVKIFDESNVVDITSFVRLNPSAGVNRVTATYTDPSLEFKANPVTVEDLGNTFEQDSGSASPLDLHMFHDVDVTILRAFQELVQLSEGIASGKLITNRYAYDLNIGDVVKFSWDALGVSGLLIRITEKKVGDMDDREIELTFIQDVYGIGTAVYGPPGGSNWIDIYNDPEDVTIHKYVEQPYYLINKYTTDQVKHGLFLLLEFPTNDTVGYEPWMQVNGSSYQNYLGADLDENPSSTLFIDYLQSYGPSYDTVEGLKVVGQPPDEMVDPVTALQMQDDFKHWILVDGELMSFTDATNNGDGSWNLNNVYRGLIDTSPAKHLAGSRVWYLDSSFIRFNREFAVDDIVNTKTLTTASRGTLDIANAAAKPFTVVGRYDKPLRPANVTINSGYYPDFITGELSIGWSNRNKETLTLTKWTDADEAMEAGQTVTLRIYDSGSALIREVTGLTSTTYTYPIGTELTDAGSIQTQLTVELTSDLAGDESFAPFSLTFARNIGQDPTGISLPLDTFVAGETSGAIDFDLDALA